MRPLKTPLIQAAHDHAKTALDMLNRRLDADGLDDDELSAQVHLFECVKRLDTSLAREARR